MASVTLTMRARRGSRSSGVIDAPATSQVPQMTTIMVVSAPILEAASVVAASARWLLAKTEAIAIHAFGLAMPRTSPPPTEAASEAPANAVRGGGVAM